MAGCIRMDIYRVIVVFGIGYVTKLRQNIDRTSRRV